MSTDVTSGFFSDGFFIISDSVKLSNENDGTLGGTQVPIGLSKVPYLQEDSISVVPNEYGIEKRQAVYNPEFKEDVCHFNFWRGATYAEIKKTKYDSREYDATGVKVPVQRKSKIGDNNGRLGRYITEFSRKQQKHMRTELCQLDIKRMPYSPLWIDLTTTPYVYKLRDSGVTNAVSIFCKDGLKRFRERLRTHDQYKHLTGMYKWEFTVSELPHLHLMAWFDKWTGDPSFKEHQFIDLDWFALNWFESLFPTKELQEENSDHLKAGTRVEKIRGYSKKHAQRKLIKKVESYSQDKLEQDLKELQEMSESDFTDAMKMEGKGGAWEKASNYLTKYITKENQDTPEGWGNSRFHGVINRSCFKSYQAKISWETTTEQREAIHTAFVQIENEKIVKHVEMSKNLDYLIKRAEKRVYVHQVDWVGLCLDGTDDELNEMEGGVCRRFHERWQSNYQPEDLIDEDGKPKRDDYGNLLEIKRYKGMVLHEDEELLDEEGNPKQYVLEFFDHVYDTHGNFIGVYEYVRTETKVMETDELTHDVTWEDDDGNMRTTREFLDPADAIRLDVLEGIDAYGIQDKHQFILTNKDGEVLETHDNWENIKGRRIRNEDEHRYFNSRSMYGVDYKEVLTRAFPNHSFTIEDYGVTKTSLDKNDNYFKEEIKLCLSIKPLITVEQEARHLMQLQAS